MKKEMVLSQVLWAAFCALALVCIAVSLVVWFRPLYYWDLDYLKIPEHTGIPEILCRQNYDALIDYNLLGGPSRLVLPDFSMSEGGRIHFEEVKVIFYFCQVVALVGTATLIGKILWQLRRGKGDFRWLKWAGRGILLVILLIGGLMAINWDLAFLLMHKLLFRNNLWIFDVRTDPIIKILPDHFFLHCGILILVLLFVLLFSCSLLAKYLNQRLTLEKKI